MIAGVEVVVEGWIKVLVGTGVGVAVYMGGCAVGMYPSYEKIEAENSAIRLARFDE